MDECRKLKLSILGMKILRSVRISVFKRQPVEAATLDLVRESQADRKTIHIMLNTCINSLRASSPVYFFWKTSFSMLSQFFCPPALKTLDPDSQNMQGILSFVQGACNDRMLMLSITTAEEKFGKLLKPLSDAHGEKIDAYLGEARALQLKFQKKGGKSHGHAYRKRLAEVVSDRIKLVQALSTVKNSIKDASTFIEGIREEMSNYNEIARELSAALEKRAILSEKAERAPGCPGLEKKAKEISEALLQIEAMERELYEELQFIRKASEKKAVLAEARARSKVNHSSWLETKSRKDFEFVPMLAVTPECMPATDEKIGEFVDKAEGMFSGWLGSPAMAGFFRSIMAKLADAYMKNGGSLSREALSSTGLSVHKLKMSSRMKNDYDLVRISFKMSKFRRIVVDVKSPSMPLIYFAGDHGSFNRFGEGLEGSVESFRAKALREQSSLFQGLLANGNGGHIH